MAQPDLSRHLTADKSADYLALSGVLSGHDLAGEEYARLL
jgi:hypothetical protein